MKIRKIVCALIALAVICGVIVSCGEQPVEETTGIVTNTESTKAEITETSATNIETEETTTTTTTTTAATTTKATRSGTKYEIVYDGPFDEDNIVFQFGVVSDTHQTGNSDQYSTKLRLAFNTIKKLSNGKLDAVLCAGDLTDSATESHSSSDCIFSAGMCASSHLSSLPGSEASSSGK